MKTGNFTRRKSTKDEGRGTFSELLISNLPTGRADAMSTVQSGCFRTDIFHHGTQLHSSDIRVNVQNWKRCALRSLPFWRTLMVLDCLKHTHLLTCSMKNTFLCNIPGPFWRLPREKLILRFNPMWACAWDLQMNFKECLCSSTHSNWKTNWTQCPLNDKRQH